MTATLAYYQRVGRVYPTHSYDWHVWHQGMGAWRTLRATGLPGEVSTVGPPYRSKAEALAAIPDDAGCPRCGDVTCPGIRNEDDCPLNIADDRAAVRPAMNASERAAWRSLVELGARETELGGKRALDLTPIRVTNARRTRQLLSAVVEVVGRSGANRRHVDRYGAPVFVVTDETDR